MSNDGFSYVDTTYNLTGQEMTLVTPHPESKRVSLYVPGYSLEGGRGVCISFCPQHIEYIEKVLALLSAYEGTTTAFTTNDIARLVAEHFSYFDLTSDEARAIAKALIAQWLDIGAKEHFVYTTLLKLRKEQEAA